MNFTPPLVADQGKTRGGKTHTVRTFDQNFSRLRRDFTTFLLTFGSIYHVFRIRNDCFSSCVYFFAPAAHFVFSKLFVLQPQSVLCMTLCK